MRWKIALVAALSLSILVNNPVLASKGGVEQVGNQFVVGFTFLDNGTPSLCNGALVAPTVIATARHCVVNEQGIFATNYVFSAPGARLDAPIDGTKVPTGINRLVIPQQSPVTGIDSRLDLAFIITNRPFTSGKPILFATPQQIAELSEVSSIAGYGYGAVYETGEKYSSLPRKFDLSWRGISLTEGTTSMYELLSEETAACKGDSGGPITAKLSDGREVLVGVISGAAETVEGCGTKLSDNYYRSRITLTHPYVAQIPPSALSSSPKSKKIVCVKGTKKRVVTGVNPKCPKGFKLKK